MSHISRTPNEIRLISESSDRNRHENVRFCYSQSEFIALNTIKNAFFSKHSNQPQNDWPVTGNVNGTKHFSQTPTNERRIKQFIHKLWLSLSMLITHSTNSSIFYPFRVRPTDTLITILFRVMCCLSAPIRRFSRTHESSTTLLICFSLLHFHSLLFCF